MSIPEGKKHQLLCLSVFDGLVDEHTWREKASIVMPVGFRRTGGCTYLEEKSINCYACRFSTDRKVYIPEGEKIQIVCRHQRTRILRMHTKCPEVPISMLLPQNRDFEGTYKLPEKLQKYAKTMNLRPKTDS